MKRWIFVLCPIFAITVCFAGERGVPASCGVLNFGRVDDSVYRGGQPDEVGLEGLKQLGIKTIINLRMANDAFKTEAELARNHSMVYTNVPMTGIGRPSDEQINLVLSLIKTLPSPVFIHCQHGCDRTGTVIACYRIKHDAWSANSALQEAKRYGLSFFERGMRAYVLDFAKAIKPDAPTLTAKK